MTFCTIWQIKFYRILLRLFFQILLTLTCSVLEKRTSESFRLVVPTYILEEFNTIPSPVFSQIKRVLLLQSGQWPICPGTLLLLIFKRVENDGRPPKESWGREVDSCLNEAISQNHHLYSSSPTFSSKILIWKQFVFEYSIVHKTLRMVGLLLVVLKLVARQNAPFIG